MTLILFMYECGVSGENGMILEMSYSAEYINKQGTGGIDFHELMN